MQLQVLNISLILSIVSFTLDASACSNRGGGCGLFEHCCGDNLKCDNKVFGGVSRIHHANFNWDAGADGRWQRHVSAEKLARLAECGQCHIAVKVRGGVTGKDGKEGKRVP